MTLRVVFMGTPDFAVPTLSEIVGQGHEVVAVYTRAPARAGRGMAERPSPVHAAAHGFGIPVLTPSTLRTPEAAETFAAHGADVAVVVAYGMILPEPILAAPELGCLNLHASLLPRWRGAASSSLRRRPKASPTRPRSPTRKRRSTGRSPLLRCTTSCAGSRRFQAPSPRSISARARSG